MITTLSSCFEQLMAAWRQLWLSIACSVEGYTYRLAAARFSYFAVFWPQHCRGL